MSPLLRATDFVEATLDPVIEVKGQVSVESPEVVSRPVVGHVVSDVDAATV
ncbi:hypothetical protein FM125_11130 [Micrococcus lylae]|uniref:Uncharacterized protein n=1 Tax=Micrococcus lylae TaxID=1273 RepID=A0A1R4JWY8_9MICC|nr:hypothetical protein FM125_11130 [Micrococcus lylae]